MTTESTAVVDTLENENRESLKNEDDILGGSTTPVTETKPEADEEGKESKDVKKEEVKEEEKEESNKETEENKTEDGGDTEVKVQKDETPERVEAENSSGGATSSSTQSDKSSVQAYHVKWIKWHDQTAPIITQNENGPCPLIAIMNVLLLRGTVTIPQMVEIVSADQLVQYLGDWLLEKMPEDDASEGVKRNYEQNMHDAMEIITKLQTGLDVNVKFTGVKDFEYTQECVVFDLLNIGLYHGWMYDPQNSAAVSAVGTCSYNQLVERIIASKSSGDEEAQHSGLVAEQFLESTASQLTYHGLCELNSAIGDEELCVLFRNNHFSTIYKYKNELYVLGTDQGFLTESNVVWETLTNVEGDSHFVNGEFKTSPPSTSQAAAATPMSPSQQQESDFLVALSLQEEQKEQEDLLAQAKAQQIQDGQQSDQPDRAQLTDLELAMQLQQEEDNRAAQMLAQQEQQAAQQAQQQQQQQQGSPRHQQQPAAQGAAGAAEGAAAAEGGAEGGGQRRKEEKNCCIL
ncbi:ubiquitin carboxyl-terminal hydrolase MINDY-2-like [Amphiura filiformis]|uniref:ubiquitin carboxyl-terminal hydrolase MINDY-2-like n=1 Tax=Amphiura filiformis TaxID=82378 RepID=UPI003B2131FC